MEWKGRIHGSLRQKYISIFKVFTVAGWILCLLYWWVIPGIKLITFFGIFWNFIPRRNSELFICQWMIYIQFCSNISSNTGLFGLITVPLLFKSQNKASHMSNEHLIMPSLRGGVHNPFPRLMQKIYVQPYLCSYLGEQKIIILSFNLISASKHLP